MTPEIVLGLKAISLLIGLCFLTAVVLRRQKELRQTVLLVLEIEIIFLCGLVGWWVYNTDPAGYNLRFLHLKRLLISDTPPAVRSAADNYVLSRIGPDYFARNLVFDRQLSGPTATGGWYQVVYHFAPLQNYAAPDLLKIPVFNGQVTPDFTSADNEVPDCLDQPDYCNFNLTKDDYRTLQQQYKLDSGWTVLKPPYLFVTDCRDSKSYQLDYRSKIITPNPVTFTPACSVNYATK